MGAIENYRKAVELNPNLSEGFNNLGSALAAEGKFDQAIENYRKAPSNQFELADDHEPSRVGPGRQSG